MLQKYFFNYVLRNLSVLKITVLIVEPKNSTATTQTMQQLNQNLTLNMKLVTGVEKCSRAPPSQDWFWLYSRLAKQTKNKHTKKKQLIIKNKQAKKNR